MLRRTLVVVAIVLVVAILAGCSQPAQQGSEPGPQPNRGPIIDDEGYTLVEVGAVWEGEPLGDPTGVAVQRDGTVVISDGMGHQLLRFSPEGEFIAAIGEQGRGPGQFVHPGAVALDAQGNLYVADRGNNRVQILDPQGQLLAQVGSRDDFSPFFSLQDGYDIPLTGVAPDSDGNVYLTLSGAFYDISENSLRKYSATGELLLEIGSMLEGDVDLLPFTRPGAVGVDREGTVYLTHGSNAHGKVMVIPMEGGQPHLEQAFQFGPLGKGKGEFMHTPGGIVVDDQGYIFVADTHNNRVQVFDSQGEWLLMLRLKGTPYGELTEPGALALDQEGNLYVVDRGNARVLKIGNPVGGGKTGVSQG